MLHISINHILRYHFRDIHNISHYAVEYNSKLPWMLWVNVHLNTNRALSRQFCIFMFASSSTINQTHKPHVHIAHIWFKINDFIQVQWRKHKQKMSKWDQKPKNNIMIGACFGYFASDLKHWPQSYEYL